MKAGETSLSKNKYNILLHWIYKLDCRLVSLYPSLAHLFSQKNKFHQLGWGFLHFCFNIAGAIHSKARALFLQVQQSSRIPTSPSKMHLTSGPGSPITSSRRVSINTTTNSPVQTNLPLYEGGDGKEVNSTTRCFWMKTQNQNAERTRDINYLWFLPL